MMRKRRPRERKKALKPVEFQNQTKTLMNIFKNYSHSLIGKRLALPESLMTAGFVSRVSLSVSKRKVLYDIYSKDFNMFFGYDIGLQLQRGKRMVSASQVNANQLCSILFEICIIPN